MTLIANDVFKQLLSFRKERDWEQFHTPKNLSAALSVEAAELLEIFQWAREIDLAETVARERKAIEDEVADIAILLSYFCHDLDSVVKGLLRYGFYEIKRFLSPKELR